MSRIADIARDFAGRGGKRLRPRLCQAVFDACGGTGDLSPVCEAVESFHKASLVHDDIQDGDETRYDRPTVWKEHGVPVAIAVGDWLVAHGYRLIARSGFAAVQSMLSATVGPSADFYYAIMNDVSDMLFDDLTPEETAEMMADDLGGMLEIYARNNR